MDGTELDVTTLLVGLAVIIIGIALAQLFLFLIDWIRKRIARRRAHRSDQNLNGFDDEHDLLS